ncbi:MAG: ferritin family protein [Candidatus Marinimicrobia bacterium]|nr:ferritin family protein [Candidatus Neomarinimicrobiota bacterium]
MSKELYFKSIDEILNFAIEKEQEASDFYQEWSQKAKDKQITEMFSQFAEEEQGHKRKLQNVQKTGGLPKASRHTKNLKISDYMVEVDPEKEMGLQDAIILAMQREKKAFQLYSDMEELTDDQEIQQLFEFLANEEAKHKLRFEVQYDEIILTDN